MSKYYSFIQSLLLLLLICQSVYSQTFNKNNNYKAWINSYTQDVAAVGFLFELKDSSIVLAASSRPSGPIGIVRELPIQDIELMQFRRAVSVENGIIAGAFGGLVVGVLIGTMVSPPQRNLGEHAAARGLYIAKSGLRLAIPCALIGALKGTRKIKIPINGDHQKYEERKNELERFKLRRSGRL